MNRLRTVSGNKSGGYGLSSKDEAKAYPGNPLDNLEPLAQSAIPLLVIYGDADEALPILENCVPLIEKYRQIGGPIEVIVKPGGKHHPHCLGNPEPIVRFVKKSRPCQCLGLDKR